MKKTIKYVTIVLAMLFSVSAYSQNCEYEINKVDKFTNEKTILTKPVVVGKKVKISKGLKMKRIKWSLKEENKGKYLIINYHFIRGTIAMVGSENLNLLLSNGELVKLKLRSLVSSMNSMNFKGYEMEFEYILTEQDLSKLIENDVTDVRVEARINGFDFSIMKGISTKLLFKCI